MKHFGVFVELQPHPVAAQIAHHRESVFLGVLLNGIAYVAHETKGVRRLHAYLQALFRHTHQLFLFGSCFSDDEHTGGIREIAVQNGRHIHVDDVALFQDFLFIRYAVTHHFVDGSANAFREAFIVERCGDCSVRHRVVVHQLVYLRSAHAGMNLFFNQIQHSGVHHSALADTFYLLRSLYQFACRHQATSILIVENFLVEFSQFRTLGNLPVVHFSTKHIMSCLKNRTKVDKSHQTTPRPSHFLLPESLSKNEVNLIAL